MVLSTVKSRCARYKEYSQGEVESIRRRFYVAMTRAAKLVFSFVRSGEVDGYTARACDWHQWRKRFLFSRVGAGLQAD